MDYKYIEQLLERYWQCETSQEEEAILRTFFSQDELPAHLRKYRSLFAYANNAAKERPLGEDFDSMILAMTEDKPAPVKARTITLSHRMMPLFKAAAVVAIIITIGNAAQLPIGGQQEGHDDINYANYSDTYTDPSMAYDEMHDALELVSQGFCSAMAMDTITATKPQSNKDTTHQQ